MCNVYNVYVNVGVENMYSKYSICVFPPWTRWLSQPWEYSRNEQPAEYSLLVASIPALAFIIHSPYTPIYVVIFPFLGKKSFTLLQRRYFPFLTEVEFVGLFFLKRQGFP